METGFNGSGAGIGALLLSLGTLFTLTEKNILSPLEARDAVDIALGNLKTFALAGPLNEETARSVESILKNVRDQLR